MLLADLWARPGRMKILRFWVFRSDLDVKMDLDLCNPDVLEDPNKRVLKITQ